MKLPLISLQAEDLGSEESKLEALCKAESMLLKTWRPALTDEEAVQKEVYAAACSVGTIQVALQIRHALCVPSESLQPSFLMLSCRGTFRAYSSTYWTDTQSFLEFLVSLKRGSSRKNHAQKTYNYHPSEIASRKAIIL